VAVCCAQPITGAHDTIRTGSLSRAAVMLVNEAVLRIDQDTSVYLVDIPADEQSVRFDLTHWRISVIQPAPACALKSTHLFERRRARHRICNSGRCRSDESYGVRRHRSGFQQARQSGGSQRPICVGLRGSSALVHIGPATRRRAMGPLLPADPRYFGNECQGVRAEFAASAAGVAQHDARVPSLPGKRCPDQRDAILSVQKRCCYLLGESTKLEGSSIGR
jgi:hypothetical protein